MWKWLKTYIASDSIQIAKHALGKYIIGFSCLLHLGWASLIAINPRAVNATPLSGIYILCQQNIPMTIFILVSVAVMASLFLSFRLRQRYNLASLAVLLLPQQIILWISAGSGIWATVVQHYADGIERSWAHIATDQLSIILMAFLYTIAILESSNPPIIGRIAYRTDHPHDCD
jgi:hypothetical protein